MKHPGYVCALALAALATAYTPPAPAAEKGNALFTLYYVAEVSTAKKGGVTGKVQTADGKWIKYRVSPADHRQANMQGTVVSTEPDGKRIVSSIVRIGVWKDLPDGWRGRGNRQNPLVPYRSVAADQKIYPYGSRLYLPSVDGYKTPDGQTLDGYFWVADVGGRIKGRLRFDIFVGDQPVFREIQKFDAAKWRGAVVIDRLPSVPKAWDPRTVAGLRKVLGHAGCNSTGDVDATKAKTTSVRRIDGKLKACLIEFQKRHDKIPAVEHGMVMGTITLWHLTQAALAGDKAK